MKEIFDFLKDLKQNNNRVWFQAHKERYFRVKSIYEQFIRQIIDGISTFDPEIKGLETKDCIFRVYRDIRFSSDKSPYKTHMGAFMVQGGKMNPRGGYYVHLAPGESLLAGGIWCPSPALLKALRQDIYDNIEEFTSIIREEKFARYYYLDGEKLKKVPSPFPKDFSEAELLKYRNYTVTCNLPDAFFEGKDVVDRIVERLKILLPFNRFLNYTVEESTQKYEISL